MPRILGIGGTTQPGSSSEKALRTSLAAAQAAGATIEMISGADLILPPYAYGAGDNRTDVAHLVAALRRADGVIIASPSYHGSISGLLKNALDYAEELANDERVYLDGVPVGLIACAAGWQGAGQTLQTLRSIVHALRGWPTPLGATINTSLPIFDHNGECVDASARFQLETVGKQVAQFCNWRQACEVAPSARKAS